MKRCARSDEGVDTAQRRRERRPGGDASGGGRVRGRSAVMKLGDKFGHTDGMKGKKVVIEHTSSNPNGPLHIGNLRNVMIGAHLANCMKAVGYDVSQAFYVNDLGAQIGLTALAYTR